MKKSIIAMGAAGIVCILTGVAFGQGSLVPPTGPIEPTGRSLDEIQPRIPITSLPFVIEKDGSYVVVHELGHALQQDGIIIMSNVANVDIDLNGFALVGGGTNTALLLPAVQAAREAARRVSVHNGKITNWGYGVRVEPPIGPTAASGAPKQVTLKRGVIRMVDVHVSDCTGAGFAYADGSVRFIRCASINNGGDGLMLIGDVGTVEIEDCFFDSNGGNGIALISNPTAPVQFGGWGNDLLLAGTDLDRNGGVGFLMDIKTADSFPSSTAIKMTDCSADGNALGGIRIMDERDPNAQTNQTNLEFLRVRAARNGFTGILVGLLLPAVQGAREAARRSTCKIEDSQSLNNAGDGFNIKGMGKLSIARSSSTGNSACGNNLRQLSLAIIEYNDASANGENGFLTEGCDTMTIQNSQATYNGKNGYLAIEMKKVYVSSFNTSNNDAHGFMADGTPLRATTGATQIVGGAQALTIGSSQSNNNGGDGYHLINLSNVKMTDTQASANGANGGVWKTTNFLTTDNCSFTSNSQAGVMMVKVRGANFGHSFIGDNGGPQMAINGNSPGTAEIDFVEVAGGGAGDGINIMNSLGCIIHDCTVRDVENGIVFSEGKGHAIYRNTIRATNALSNANMGNDIGPTGSASSATSPWANIILPYIEQSSTGGK